MSADTARRLADEPEFASIACRAPMTFANARSKRAANRPVVSQKSRPESTRCWISLAPNTRPDTGTGDWPGTKGAGTNAAA